MWIRRAIRQPEQGLDGNHLPRRTRRGGLDLVHEGVLGQHRSGRSTAPSSPPLRHLGARFERVRIGVRIIQDRATSTYLPPIWLMTFAYFVLRADRHDSLHSVSGRIRRTRYGERRSLCLPRRRSVPGRGARATRASVFAVGRKTGCCFESGWRLAWRELRLRLSLITSP